MNNLILSGCYTALVTPFRENGDLDEDALRRLVDRQIDQGITGLVPCGTTGESVTLEPGEYHRVMEIVIRQSAGSVPVICGAGGNNTREVIRMAQTAQDLGADALLSVCPYYNKPSQPGLVSHYESIAAAVSIPIVLYNVPGRTGVNMTAETTLKLAAVPNIIAVKEASGDLTQIMTILKNRPEGFSVLSGDDALTLPLLAAGGDGVISVIANQLPGEFTQMVTNAHHGDWQSARDIHYRLLTLMQLNFVESNPVPVKTSLALMGFIGNTVRQPLCAMTAFNTERLTNELISLNLLNKDALTNREIHHANTLEIA